jgi:hypothetical protein
MKNVISLAFTPLLFSNCKIYLLYSLAFLFITNNSYAQDSTKMWQPSIEVNFTAVPTYAIAGTDTSFQNSLSVAPSFVLRNKNGFGVSYSPKFITGGSKPGIYMHEVMVGFEQYDKKSFDFFAEYNHFFFVNNSSIPVTPITNELFTGITYKKSWIRPMFSIGLGFGTNPQTIGANAVYDVALSAGISHPFTQEIKGADISITPSLKLNAGTNQYFSFMHSTKYISSNKNFNKYIKKKIGKNTTGTSSQAQTLSISNMELALQASYQKGAFSILPATSFIFPLSSNDGSGVSAYWQLAVRYDF